jgi:uncharacterized protein YpmS
MKRWMRVILIGLAAGLALLLAAAGAGEWMYHGRPAWYHHSHLTPAQAKAAANRADQKLADVFSWVASVQAQSVRRHLGTSAPADQTDPPANSKTVTLSDEELNAFIQAWENPDKSQLQQTLAQFFSEGRLILVEDGIIVAGQSTEFGTLASAQFNPVIDPEGKLWLRFAGIQAGLLPLPQSVVANKVERFTRYLRDRLSIYVQTANLDPTLTANGAAVEAGYTRLLLEGLNGGSSAPILFVPFDLGNFHRAMPVKLSAIKLSQGQVTLTLEPLSDSEQATVQDLIEKPYTP